MTKDTGDSASREVPLFLEAKGEMSAMIASHDWSDSIGPVAEWPQSLKAIVGFLLRSPVPMVLLWGKPGYMIYNDGYSIFAGDRHLELLGKRVREGWPEVAEFNDNVMTVGLAGGTLAYKDQELVLNRTGKPEKGWMNLDYSHIIDETGRPGGVITIVVETTERVLAERRQAHAAARQRRQFEQAPGFIIVMNGPEHVVEFVNDTHRQVFGSNNWVGKTIREAFPSLKGQGFFETLDQVYRTGENYEAQSAEVRYRRAPDGPEEIRYLTFIYAPVSDENGKIIGIFCDGFDVTEAHLAQAALRNSEAALRESEAQFRSFAQAMANQVWAATPEGQLDWFNDRTLQFSGLEFGDLVGDKWTSIVHPEDVQTAGVTWARAISTGETYEAEFRLRRATVSIAGILPEPFLCVMKPARSQDG